MELIVSLQWTVPRFLAVFSTVLYHVVCFSFKGMTCTTAFFLEAAEFVPQAAYQTPGVNFTGTFHLITILMILFAFY